MMSFLVLYVSFFFISDAILSYWRVLKTNFIHFLELLFKVVAIDPVC